VLKRVFPAGSSGRLALYRLRQRVERSTQIGGSRPQLPIDDAADEFIQMVKEINAKRIVIILASTKLDVDEGQRSTNLAFELARSNIPCIFGYWRWDQELWLPQDRLDEGILLVPVDVLANWPETFLRESFTCEDKILLFEFPHPSFFKILSEANAAGWITIYDVVDDWQEFHLVDQAIWYDAEFEQHLINAADAVTVVSRGLQRKVQSSSIKTPSIVPNGLSEDIVELDAERPLERGRITVGYFGYLAGAWFDWDLVVKVSYRNPDWQFYLIGYGGTAGELSVPNNLHLLGKVPRSELASYAVNWDVAIIPFKPEKLAEGADPIKSYEYMAMGLPVVMTGVFPPPGTERLLRRVEGVYAFEEAIRMEAAEKERLADVRIEFAKRSTWANRLNMLLGTIENSDQHIAEKRALFGKGR
jgi:glycosyltransferase involved in cell wall biosynthesis